MGKKQLKDYAHLYIGCEIELDKQKFKEPAPDDRRFQLTAVDVGFGSDSFKVKHLGWYTFDGSPIHHDKLVLRRLRDITDEEFIDICKIEGMVNAEIRTRNGKISIHAVDDSYSLNLIFNDPSQNIYLQKYGAVIALAKTFEINRYLLSKGFDLFGLIPSGIAIDKITLPGATK